MAYSKAYKEGFASKKNLNPYEIGTQEYNDYDRGWSQRVKRGLSYGEKQPLSTSVEKAPLRKIYGETCNKRAGGIKPRSYSEMKGK